MPEQAQLVETEAGLEPQGAGWFVVNAREAAWGRREPFGRSVGFEGEGDAEFRQLGINIHVLEPGNPSCMYHRENLQEDFLVLSGECLLLIEGDEQPLRAWDFVHCPPGTNHVFVGAGGGPCVVLMVGARSPDEEIVYPVEEVALRHGAGVEQETPHPKEAYARFAPGERARYREGDLT